MKKIILLITIIALSVSCKRPKSIEPDYVPKQTEKVFSAKITYKQDSLGTYYLSTNFCPASSCFLISTKNPNDPTFDGNVDYLNISTACNLYVGWVGECTFNGYCGTRTNDINTIFKYYITMRIELVAADNINHKNITVIKQYTFTEGDNGSIDFRLIP